MNYCIVDENNVVTNIIVCDDEKTAKELGAVFYYDGAEIGKTYDPYNYYALTELQRKVEAQKQLLDTLTGVTE